MVFFTCNACGESVKKVQVEKHVAMCRSCECLSCIDCGKDFWGDDYKNHVKCISEDQKYGGKGYEGKTHKGDVKQQAWLQKINELMKRSSVSPKVKELLEQISGFDNVPRKKAKFQNWMKNSLRVYSEAVLEQVWSLVSEASSGDLDGHQKPPGPAAHLHADSTTKTSSSGADETAAKPAEVKKNKRERKEERQKNRKKEKKELKLENHQENGKGQKAKKLKLDQADEAGGKAAPRTTGPAGKKKRKGQQAVNGGTTEDGGPKALADKRKRKHSDAAVPVEAESKKKKILASGRAEDGEAENSVEAPSQVGKFNWKGTIKAVLKQAPDNEIAVKKLRKKVLAQYHAVSREQHLSEEQLLAIFNRKISKNPSLKLLKDKVKLLK